VGKDEPELLAVRSFGKTSLREVKRKLEEMGLSLGMQVSDAPPEPAMATVPALAPSVELAESEEPDALPELDPLPDLNPEPAAGPIIEE
jgi:hypothetical protein